MSLYSEIQDRINEFAPGTIFYPEDFSAFNNPDVTYLALSRMEDLGLILRLAKGIYLKPKAGRISGDILPTVDEVVRAIAKKDKVRIVPSGSHALYRLGLTTQLPMNVVYLTDGSPRKLSIGKRKIQFKRTTPKILAIKGEGTKLVVQALKTLGKDTIKESEIEKMIAVLKKEDRQQLREDIALVPHWIGKILAKAL